MIPKAITYEKGMSLHEYLELSLIHIFRHTEAVFAACAGRVIGADVCGDVSDYEYASPFKRFLSRLDGQEPCDPQALRGWQEGQRAVNAALLESLGKVLREPEASTRVSPILRRFS